MPGIFARSITTLGAIAQLAIVVPYATPADAQRWEDRRGHDRDRWNDRRDDRNRRDWDRRRRNDAKTDGIVAGVVGTALVAGIIAAATSGNKDRKRTDERAEYCRDRYGNYDRDSDGYRAADGRIYRCE